MKQKRNLKDETIRPKNNFQNISQQSYTIVLGDALRITFLH